MRHTVKIFIIASVLLAASMKAGAQEMDMEVIGNQPTPNVAAAMHGMLPWLNVIFDSGLPQASPAISLRGELSENGTSPLILVDGVEIPLEMLVPSDIESIIVLKDASAAAIYGARAAAGAILVRTKNSGKKTMEGKGISVNAFAGFSSNIGSDGMFDNGAFNNMRLTHSYNVSAHGGNENFSYYAGGSYYGQDGMYPKACGRSGYGRVGMTGNFNARINRWLRYSMGFNYVYRSTTSPFWGRDRSYFDAVCSEPSSPYVDVASSDYVYSSMNNHFVSIKNSLVAAIAEGLDLEVSYAFLNNYSLHCERSVNIDGIDETIAPDFFSEIRDRISDSDVTATLSFDRVFADRHHIVASAGFDMQFGENKKVSAAVGNLVDQSISVLTIGDGKFDVGEHKGEYTRLGGYVNGSYSFDDRYSVSLTVRSDASSMLPKKNRTAFSAAGSAAWTISSEKFFEQAKKYVNVLKIRYSYASLANETLGMYYGYIPTIDTSKGKVPFMYDRISLPEYSGLNRPVSYDLSPERAGTHGLGVDVEFLGSRLSFSSDFFSRKVTDMLTFNGAVSAMYGDKAPYMNQGTASTSGYELSVGWKDSTGTSSKPLAYSVKAMFADHFTTLKSLPSKRASYALDCAIHWAGLDFSALFNGSGRYLWPVMDGMVDCSYFCLRNIRLGYTFSFSESSVLKSLLIGVSGQNIFITGGSLPASFSLATGGTGNRYPMSVLMNVGINF